jgi:polar amino acid transport system substrate-binding protein
LSAMVVQAEEQTPFRLVYADSYPPLSSGEVDKVQGVLPSLMDYILREKMSMIITHSGKAWKRVQNEVWSGSADALITSINPSRLENSLVSKSVIFPLTFHPFTKKGSLASKALNNNTEIKNLGRFRFCDVLGNGWGEAFYKKHGISFVASRSFDLCLRMLVNDRVDIIIHSDHILSEIIRKNGWENQIVAHSQIIPESPNFYLLLSKKSKFGQEFLTAFDRVVEDMQRDGSYQQLLAKLNINFGLNIVPVN